MKKSSAIVLALVGIALASCNKPDYKNGRTAHMRSDTTAPYTNTHNTFLWYYAFRPYGIYQNGHYERSGYYSGAIHESSNIGHNASKATVSRGGFGKTGGVSVGT